MKYLIVNGDDFGLSPGINRGIVEAHRTWSASSVGSSRTLRFGPILSRWSSCAKDGEL